jgi:polyferredoxin
MVKVGRPKGLIRYESYEALEKKHQPKPFWLRPRVWIYTGIMSAALAGIALGLSSLDALELKVIHSRQPLYVLQSDGSIQNKYTLKILNKTTSDIPVNVSITGPEGAILVDGDQQIMTSNGQVTPRTVFVRVPQQNLNAETSPVIFHVTGKEEGQILRSQRESVFIGPKT